jgi:hypothetical protein
MLFYGFFEIFSKHGEGNGYKEFTTSAVVRLYAITFDLFYS